MDESTPNTIRLVGGLKVAGIIGWNFQQSGGHVGMGQVIRYPNNGMVNTQLV